MLPVDEGRVALKLDAQPESTTEHRCGLRATSTSIHPTSRPSSRSAERQDHFSREARAALESRMDPRIARTRQRARMGCRMRDRMRGRTARQRCARRACVSREQAGVSPDGSPRRWLRIDWMTIRSVNTSTECAWWRAVGDRASRWGSRPVCSNACTE